MTPQAALSRAKSRPSRRRSLSRIRTIRGERSSEHGGFEVTLQALEPIDPDNRISHGITHSRRLVITPSGQCTTYQDEAGVSLDQTERDRRGDESSDLDTNSEHSVSSEESEPGIRRFRSELLLEGLWWLRKQSKDKHIDAAEDVLDTYHDSFLFGKVPLSIKLRAALRGGKWKPLLTWLEFLAAAILVALYVRSTYTSSRPRGLVILEYWCSGFFTVDYIVKLVSAPVLLYYIFSLTGLVDLATSLPIAFVYSNEMGSPYAFFQILLVLRIMRVMPVLTSWLVFSSTIGHQIFLLAINTFGAVFIAAGVFQWVEYRATSQEIKDANSCGSKGCLTYYQTLYLMIVTVSTVGYGDFTAKSDWGRFVIGVTILTALLILPVQIGNILQLASRRPFGGTFAVRKVIGSRFIIVSGNLSFRMVEDFLSEFYHPAHSQDMLAFPVRVVILAPYKPSFELKTLLIHYQGLVEFIEGTPTKDSDLDRVSAKVASAFFLLADQYAKDPDTEDAAQIVRTLSVHRYCGPGVRVIVEMLNPEKERSAIWDDAGVEIEIICSEAIRFKLLARSCYIKGLATFVTNLFRSGLTITKWRASEQTEWMLQYYHGMRQGVFPVILPPSFSEQLVFEKAAELVYSRYRVILIALDVLSADGRRVLLYPRGRKIKVTDVGLVIAKSLAQAENVSQFGQQQSFLSCLRRSRKNTRDDDLLREVSGKQGHSDDEVNKEYVISLDNAEEMVEQLGRLRGSGSSSGSRNAMRKQMVTNPIVIATQLHPQGCSSSECPSPPAFSKGLTLEEAVDRAMSWPPLDRTRKPELPVLERRADTIADDLEKKTLRVVSLGKPHVLVCIRWEWPLNLFSFVSQLRTVMQRHPAIVILHPSMPSAADWGCVGMFEEVYFVKGSPVYELDLLRAGVLQAEKVLILTQTKQDQRISSQDTVIDVGDVSSALIFTSDVENILIAATVERLQQPTRERVITELQDIASIQYLRPKFHLKRQHFDHKTYKRNRHALFQFAPPYIEGKGFCPSALAFLLCSTFFNRQTVSIVEQLVWDGVSKSEEKGSVLDQIDMPKHYVGVTFKELFFGMLRQEELLVLGLYRPIGTCGSVVSYVYTNPLPDEVLGAGDLVYVLRSGQS